jgi:hypothetical protein
LSKPFEAHIKPPCVLDTIHVATGFNVSPGHLVSILLCFDPSLLFSYFSLLDWKCLCIIVSWEYITFFKRGAQC